MATKRTPWVDSLRALAMIFVIYGHMYQSFWQYLLFTSPIKIPLFFAISGYLFRTDNITYSQKIKKLTANILIPYFFLSLFPIKVIYALIPSTSLHVTEVLRLFFSGEYLWYLPCCFFAEAIFFAVVKYLKKNSLIVGVSIIITAIGLVLSRTPLGCFLYFTNAMISQLFLLIGYEIKKYERIIDKANWFDVIGLVVVYIAIGLYSMKYLPNQCYSAHENRYYNIPICFSMIIIGCIAIFLIFKKLNVSWKPLVFIGQNTLTYYGFNKYFRSPVLTIFSFLGVTIKLNWFIGILLTIGCCLVCWPISLLLNKYLPISVGKKSLKWNTFSGASKKEKET